MKIEGIWRLSKGASNPLRERERAREDNLTKKKKQTMALH